MVDHLQQAGYLLALPGEQDFAYPTWQFEGRGIRLGFRTVLHTLPAEPSAQLACFVTLYPTLDDRCPLDTPREGAIDTVLHLAEATIRDRRN